MAALTGNSVGSSYQSLLKTTDNGALGATEKNMTDGLGNASTLSMGTASASFTGTLDLSGATVTGLAGAGLVSGGQTDSMVSAASLTTNAATTLNPGGIALGENAQAGGQGAVVIGRNATSPNQGWASRHVVIGDGASVTQESAMAVGGTSTAGAFATAVGTGAAATGFWSTSLGYFASANASHSVALGRDAKVEGGNYGIAIGQASRSKAENAINIGRNSIIDDSVRVDTVTIGANSKSAQYSTALGAGSFAIGANSTAISDSTAAANYGVAIGWNAAANTAEGVVALGYNVNAVNWANSTTVNQIAYANYAGLNFADDTAAATGGVPLGGVYHNAGALRIRIA